MSVSTPVWLRTRCNRRLGCIRGGHADLLVGNRNSTAARTSRRKRTTAYLPRCNSRRHPSHLLAPHQSPRLPNLRTDQSRGYMTLYARSNCNQRLGCTRGGHADLQVGNRCSTAARISLMRRTTAYRPKCNNRRCPSRRPWVFGLPSSEHCRLGSSPRSTAPERRSFSIRTKRNRRRCSIHARPYFHRSIGRPARCWSLPRSYITHQAEDTSWRENTSDIQH